MANYVTCYSASADSPCFIEELRLLSLPLHELKGFREKVKNLIDQNQYYINDNGELVVYEYGEPYCRHDCIVPNVLTMDLV